MYNLFVYLLCRIDPTQLSCAQRIARVLSADRFK